MYLSGAIRPFLIPVRGRIAATTLAAVLASAFSVGTAFGLAAATGTLLDWGDRGPADLGWALAATAGCAAARALCLWVRDQLATATAAEVKRAVRARVTAKLYELGPGHTWKDGRQGARTTVVDGVEHLQGYVGFYLPQLLVSWIVPAALLVVLAVVSPVVAGLVLVCVLLVPGAQRLWRWVLRGRARDHWERFDAFAAKVDDTVRGLPALVALGAVDRRRVQVEQAAEELRAATTANMRASLGVSGVMSAAMALGTSGATVAAAFEAARGSLPVESVLLVLFLSAECFRPQQELSGYWHEGFHGIAAAGAISRFLDTPPPVRDTGSGTLNPNSAPALSVEQLTYTFPGADRPALRDVSFAVPAGSTLAVVGASGAGKSTLGRLLLLDMDPDSGRVLLDEHPITGLSLAELRGATARVAQDVVLLSGSIRENVALAAADTPDAQARVAAAIEAARVGEVAEQLDAGLDSRVGERGRLLSGGQRQRVALARALAADARLLLLDEATSALDAENEALITEVLRAERGRRTMVVIAHRLSTVAHADLVLVLDHGRVAEFGPPGELVEQDGHWARLVRAQHAATGGRR